MTRALAIIAAVLFAAAFAIAQARGGRDVAPALEVARAEQTWIARAVSCDELRQAFTDNLAGWKAGVRKGRDTEVEPQLAAMRAILRRLEELETEGRCGG